MPNGLARLLSRNSNFKVGDDKTMTGATGKEGRAGLRIFLSLLCRLLVGSGRGHFVYTAVIIGPAGYAGEDKNVQREQTKKNLHGRKDKDFVSLAGCDTRQLY